jgi:hypothetical protein
MKEFYKKNKKYFPVLIILPTLFGALVQLIQLIRISPTFYKFFSLTQSVIDGSYILFQLILLIIIVRLYNNFANSDEFYFFETKIYMQGNSKQKSRRLFWRLFIINFAFLIGVLYLHDLIIDFQRPNLKTLIWFLVFSLFAGILISRRRTKLYLKNLLELYKKRKEPVKSNSINNVNSNYIIGLSIILIASLTFSNKIPKAEFNNTYIVNKIIQDFGLEDAEILFYNDTYLIMNLQNKDCIWKKGVFKTDNYFNPSNVLKGDDD